MMVKAGWTVKKPKKDFKQKIFDIELRKGLEEGAELTLKQFRKTVRTFEKPPKFRKDIRTFRPPFRFKISTRHKIYNMINDGTPEHVITPTKKHGLLVFPEKTVPKTTPDLISSRKGSKSKKMVFVRGPITVPGIKARNFDKAIKKFIDPKFAKIMRKRMKTAVKLSSYAIRK